MAAFTNSSNRNKHEKTHRSSTGKGRNAAVAHASNIMPETPLRTGLTAAHRDPREAESGEPTSLVSASQPQTAGNLAILHLATTEGNVANGAVSASGGDNIGPASSVSDAGAHRLQPSPLASDRPASQVGHDALLYRCQTFL